MGRLFSGSILSIYWKFLRLKNCPKAHGALFNAYSVDSSRKLGPFCPVAITRIAAIIDGKISDFSFKTLLGWRKFNIGAQDPANAH